LTRRRMGRGIAWGADRSNSHVAGELPVDRLADYDDNRPVRSSFRGAGRAGYAVQC
jgi:hypothetical protein